MMKIIIVSLMMVAWLCGCGTTPKKVTYTTLATVGSAVSNAADAAATGRLAGKISDNDWEQLKKNHNKFLLAYNQACRIAAYDFSKYAPESLITLQLEFLNMVNLVLAK